MCDTLQPHGLQPARLSCPSPTPGGCSNSCPSSRWCYPTTSSSGIPFSSCLQSFSASGSFSMTQLFTSSVQIIRVSGFSISPSNEYSGLISFRTDWFDLLAVKGTLKSFLQHHSSKSSIHWCSAFLIVGGNGNPLQCSCLENSRDREAWWAAVSGVAQSQTPLKRLSSSSFLYSPTLTSILDYWKNHSSDYMDFCQQRNVSDF